MDTESVLKIWYGLQRKALGYRATSSAGSSINFVGDRPKQINDYVFEVFKPLGSPSIELVFFHGLQLEGSKEAHLTTWLTQDGSALWLKWILEDYPEARILLISYDAFTRRTHEQGNMDMFLTCENLVQDLTMGEAQVGQAGCPVALVGHCIGGLVMKELCIFLDSTVAKLQFYQPDNREQNLFLNINGYFFYGCPHHGSGFADASKEEGEFFKEFTTLNKVAERRNEAFRKLQRERKWKTSGIGEGLETKLGRFQGFIAPEASARADVDVYYTDRDADHFTVSRPKSKKSSSFEKLRDFIRDILDEDKKRHIQKNDSSTKAVGLEGQLKTLMKELEGAQRMAIVGMPGIGKSTLAKRVYYTHWRSYHFTCYLSDVKKFMVDRDDPGYLEREILKNLYYKGRKVDQSCTWESLNKKKVLLVLDDVDLASQVPEMIDLGFSDGSHVIVTSQESGFLVQKDFKCHTVKELPTEDSRTLFCHHAFKEADIPNLYRRRVAQILGLLQGLPLGLLVVGGFLKGRGDLNLWDDVLKRLKLAGLLQGLPLGLLVVGGFLKGRGDLNLWDDVLKRLKLAKSPDGKKNDGLWSVMTMAYDKLAKEEQELFLDIATCFHGENLEEVKKAWSHCGWATTAHIGWSNLKEKNLVTTDAEPPYVIRMHEVLRKLGTSKACREHDNCTTHSRLRYDVSNPLPAGWPFSEDISKVKVLMISYPVSYRRLAAERSPHIKMQELRGLKELKVLWLDGVYLSGPCDFLPDELAYVKISHSEWSEKLGSGFPGLSGLTRLIPGFHRFYEKSGQHEKLRYLEIVDCRMEDFLTSLASLQALEDLRIISCVCKKGARIDVLGNLKALRRLEIRCHDWEALLHLLGRLPALENLVIRKCDKHDCLSIKEKVDFLMVLHRNMLLQGVGQLDLPDGEVHTADRVFVVRDGHYLAQIREEISFGLSVTGGKIK